MKVFKYEIPLSDEPKLRLPLGAQVLSVGQQNDHPFLWALVDPAEEQTSVRTFRFAGTGHEIAKVEDLKFIGTIHIRGGALVFHVFERAE